MNRVILMGRLTRNPEIKYAGKNNAVIIRQYDRPGVIASIAKVFEVFAVNIANMNVFSKEKGGTAFSVLEIDGDLNDAAMEALLRQPNIVSATYIKVK